MTDTMEDEDEGITAIRQPNASFVDPLSHKSMTIRATSKEAYFSNSRPCEKDQYLNEDSADLIASESPL